MLAINGYFDGESFQPLENVTLKKNQQVIITILDNATYTPKKNDADHLKKIEKLCGCLHQYAINDGRNIDEIMELESNAWKLAVIEKYGNA